VGAIILFAKSAAACANLLIINETHSPAAGMNRKKIQPASLVRWFLELTLAISLLTLPVKALQMQITDTDRAAIRSVIERQLIAFQKDDAVGAFAFASPGIKAQFKTPENFMRMIKTAYQPVYRPRSVLFEELTTVEGLPAQPVLLLGQDGVPVRAIYLMEKQPNGSWRINGCYLVPVESKTV
jgi:ketosteroid isomerase-like protein